MGKASKASRKFAASGQLKKTIQARHKHQQIKKKIESRKRTKAARGGANATRQDPAAPGRKGKRSHLEDGDETGGDDGETEGLTSKIKPGMSVEDFLGAGFMEGDDDEDGADDSDEDEDEAEEDDDQSFASIDDLDDEAVAHKLELSKLAEKDPEFYKYLQENDQELLDFNADAEVQFDEDEDEEGDEMKEDVPVLTKEELKKWQKALLEHQSLRALRKLLIAFRSAAHMNEDNEGVVWRIDSSSVYNKLVTTALRYTPMVLEHHVPYKTLPNGKFKPPTQNQKQKALSKLILSHFYNIVHVLGQLSSDNVEMLRVAFSESAKLVPYIANSRKAVKLYLKTCLELWSSAEDEVRISAFLAVRRLADAPDQSILDLVLKGTYLTLVRSSKSTSAHALPSINLMKNSASELYCSDHEAAYQHAFSYIRQLAVHLRNSMKTKSKESYKLVYNWQYAHSVDFWALVLAKACDTEATTERGEESPLQALIYPLVQVSFGAIKLIASSRSYPYHLQITRSLLHITQHTKTYIPLAPYLLPILTSTLVRSGSAKPKASTLRPIDMESTIRTPQQYLRTRVFAESVVEETVFVLGEWLAGNQLQRSIAFPEVVVPITVMLRKTMKKANSNGSGGGKEVGLVKALVERMEEGAKWVESRRANVTFAPSMRDEVTSWEDGVKVEETPLGKWMKVQRKSREKKRKLLEKAREGEDEILEN